MAMFMFVSNEDRITKRQVDNPEVNTAFQEALKYQPLLMIEEHIRVPNRKFFSSWFKEYKPEKEFYYQIYHETPAWDGSAYQAVYQHSGSGKKEIVIAYLHGIINGAIGYQSFLNPVQQS